MNREDQIIRKALSILQGRIQLPSTYVIAPRDVRDFLVLKLADRKAEVFAMLLCDARGGVIEYRELFHGTIDGASVYPREVVRAVIEANAAMVVLVHNHPSGVASPSDADRTITRKLSSALALIEVRVLDHVIVGGMSTYSFAEHGAI